ncbi:MAG: adenylate/guanylate cyclase domain-containing protein [Actinomycetota bacterium]
MYVLFVDLSGFTAYTERHGERAAAELASSFALRAMQAGRRVGLRPVKTVGDAVIFVTRDAEIAGRGALALLDTFDGARGGLRVHIGLAGGEVIERDGDVFGFPVNLASHLSSAAKPGQILVDGAVADHLPQRLFEVADAGTRPMKGLSRAVRLFRLLRMVRIGEVPS